jgi:hypothetical protein
MDYEGERDMQVFFMEHLKSLTIAPGKKVGRTYQQWNPADIWAVKRTEQKSLEDEITQATKNPSADNLMKLNTHLIRLLEDKELVGISLKKIDSGGSYKLFNVDSSKLLTNLTSWKALETFEMKDIKIDVTRISKGAKLVFNTQVLNEKGAQGGQSPIQPLLQRLKHDKSGVTFNNNVKDYPQTGNDFSDIIQQTTSTKYKEYKKWFNFVYKHSKNNFKQKITFDTWANNVYLAYEDRDIQGITKLLLLNFWYDAFKHHGDNPVFWTDMLYFGLKITIKGQFGPHIKIS